MVALFAHTAELQKGITPSGRSDPAMQATRSGKTIPDSREFGLVVFMIASRIQTP